MTMHDATVAALSGLPACHVDPVDLDGGDPVDLETVDPSILARASVLALRWGAGDLAIALRAALRRRVGPVDAAVLVNAL